MALAASFLTVCMLTAFVIERKKRANSLPMTVGQITLYTLCLMAISTWQNADLPLIFSPMVAVSMYLIHPVRRALSISIALLAFQFIILTTLHTQLLLGPTVVRAYLSTLVITAISHIAYCYFLHLRQQVIDSNRQHIEALQSQLKQQEEFSSVLAHETRTPLNVLLGSIEVARLDGAFKGHANAYKNLKQSADHLLELVTSTLDYRKLKAGSYTPELTECQPHALLSELMVKAKELPLADALEITLNDTIKRGLRVTTDQKKISQVISNLLANAVKFTPPQGKVTINSKLEFSCERHYWVVTVTDSGIGIAQSNIEDIFEPFVQISTGANRQFDGTGLGLTLCREVTHALNGSIAVESNLGLGSQFILKLPVDVSLKTSTIYSATPALSEVPTLNLKGKRILLIEDHPLNAEVASHMLKTHTHCDVEVNTKAEQAIAEISEGKHYDLVLMDINLGEGLNGFEATTKIHEILNSASPPIVALTAGILQSDRQKAFEAGMDGFLAKPLNITELLITLRRFFPERAVAPQTRVSLTAGVSH